MPKKVDIAVAQVFAATGLNAGAATQYLIQTPTGVLYCVFMDINQDLAFKKSSDGGLSWTMGTVIFTGTIISHSIWYDRWSGISAGLIHCAYSESGGHDTLYRTIDTESSDALSTQTTIFAGTSVSLAGSFLSISRARGGNVYCRTQIDNGTEGGFYRLPNANVPNGAWDAARTINEAAASLDMMILLPGFAADNQDMLAIFWDASANEVSRQLYDDSANTWAETSITAGPLDSPASTAFPNFAAAVDLTNSKHIVGFWTAVDTANADLLMKTVDESTITALTDGVLNSTDDQGLTAICLDLQTGFYWLFYVGKSDGSETYPTAVNVYCKCSQDGGTTWGAETQLTTVAGTIRTLYTIPRLYSGPPIVAYGLDTTNEDLIKIIFDLGIPKGTYQLAI